MSGRVCGVDGCQMKHRSGGLCSKHLREARTSGAVVPDLRFRENRAAPADVECRVVGCQTPAKYRRQRLCNAHYLRRWNNGTFDIKAKPTLQEKFEAGIESRDGCWLWGGAISDTGYGRIGSDYAHRVSHELHIGPIPEGYQVDHLCMVRRCVNPAHIEAVTQRENLRRQAEARRAAA